MIFRREYPSEMSGCKNDTADTFTMFDITQALCCFCVLFLYLRVPDGGADASQQRQSSHSYFSTSLSDKASLPQLQVPIDFLSSRAYRQTIERLDFNSRDPSDVHHPQGTDDLRLAGRASCTRCGNHSGSLRRRQD